jgi:hypothetical protein
MKCAWEVAAERMSLPRSIFYKVRKELIDLDILEVEYLGRGVSNFKIKDFK